MLKAAVREGVLTAEEADEIGQLIRSDKAPPERLLPACGRLLPFAKLRAEALNAIIDLLDPERDEFGVSGE